MHEMPWNNYHPELRWKVMEVIRQVTILYYVVVVNASDVDSIVCMRV
jgi:hypothetical protein